MTPLGFAAGSSANTTLLTRSSSHCRIHFPGRNRALQLDHGLSQVQHASDHAAAVCSAASSSTSAPATASQQQVSSSTTTSKNVRSSTVRRQPTKPQPYLVRIAGRTSSVGPAAGAIVKRLQTEDMVRVGAIDAESLTKAMIVMTAANNMSQANSGHMLVFQPTLINSQAAEPPRIPAGSMVMYTSQIMAGEVLTFNTLRVNSKTDYRGLAKAIIARVESSSHTVMECFGAQALTTAVQAVAQARKGLLIRGQDIACIITSTKKSIPTPGDNSDATAADTAAAAADGTSTSSHAPTCHRLVVLECEQRRPRALLVRSTVGVSDRIAAARSSPPAAAAN